MIERLKRFVGSDENTLMPIDAIRDDVRPGLPVPAGANVAASARPRFDVVGGWLETHAMFVIAVAVVLVITLLGIPEHLSQDGWLALVGGRSVAAHGIPTHDYFAHMTRGVRWVDQQWLAQLLMYELTRLGGLQLLTVVYVLITVVAFGSGIAAARDLGAEDLDVLTATIPGAFFYLVTAVSIRTQGFAYLLFLATLWLLASESRRPVRGLRVYAVFPILVLWGNLHGSVTLGAGLACLYGLTLLVRGVREHGPGALIDGRAWAFVIFSPLTLLATPYGSGMVHYYRATLLNSSFSRIVTEWKPVTSIPILAVPLFVLIALTAAATVRVFLQRRSPDRTRSAPGTSHPARTLAHGPALFDVLTLLVLGIGAVMAVRNVTWFGLALLVLLPSTLTMLRHGKPAPLRRARVNMVLAAATLALAGLVMLIVLTRPTAWFTQTYPSNAIPTLRSLIARDPRARILADVRYADWLIWEDPGEFSGRVAYDTSFELLTTAQLEVIGDLAADTRNAHGTVDAYPIWMLYPGNHTLNRSLLRRDGVRLVSRSRKAIIATYHFPAVG